MNVAQAIQFCTRELQNARAFFGHGTDNAADEARWLVLSALEMSPQDMNVDPGHSFGDAQLKKLRSWLDKRVVDKIPLAYITGEAWFCGLPFYVDQSVLIPRSPIAEIIAEGFSPWLRSDPENVLDLCTGSGCIGIATALQFPESSVIVTDISPEALVVCQKNIERHGVANRVLPMKADIFDGVPAQKFDLIVSNPPYVTAAEIDTLPSEYQHEPDLGLRAAEQGLEFVERIFVQAHQYLAEHGLLIVEVGNSDLAVMDRWPHIEFTWLEFAYGGHGVLLLERSQLANF